MYKPGGEDVVGDASAEGSTGRPGRMWKTRGAVRAAMFGLRLIWMCSGGKLCEVVMIWTVRMDFAAQKFGCVTCTRKCSFPSSMGAHALHCKQILR